TLARPSFPPRRSSDLTGWPATDWVEDMMLRTQSPETYDKWVRNEIPFDDPAVIGAIEEFGWFARNDKFVAGGSAAVASTDFRDRSEEHTSELQSRENL